MGDKVTTSMPGNPHINDARALNQQAASNMEYDDHNGAIATALLAQTQATLALAHEQRTATLVNMVRMYADLGMGDQAAGIIDTITNRLGGAGHE